MTNKSFPWAAIIGLTSACALMLLCISCADDSKAAATKSEVDLNPNLYTVEHPESFKLAVVETAQRATTLQVNGIVTPDINRSIHVTSQGSGRVIELKVRLGDHVTKGQVLLTLFSADLAGAFSDYQKAIADARLSSEALDRARLLNAHGALAEKDLQLASNTDEKARADVRNTEQRVRLMGGDPAHPGSTIELRAPISGTIVEQNVAGFEGIKSLDNSPSLFTIADLNQVWVLCDVFENELSLIHVGDTGEIRMNAYADRVYRGRVVDISRVLDPTTRSAKIRIVLPNIDGSLRPGMFGVATLRSSKTQDQLVVPSTALMRLQDRDWSFRKDGPQEFERVEVHLLQGSTDGVQPIRDGLRPGDQIVRNALEFSSAIAEHGK